MNSIKPYDNQKENFVSEKEANGIVTAMQADILKRLHVFFKQAELKYFAFGELLQCCVYCRDFSEENNQIKNYQIGLIRDKYEKAKELLKEKVFDSLYEIRKDVEEYDEYSEKIRYCSIQIGRYIDFYTENNGQVTYFHRFCCIEICPFDYLPDGEKEAGDFLTKVSELNRLYGRRIAKDHPDFLLKNPLPLKSKIVGALTGDLSEGTFNKIITKYNHKSKCVACLSPRISRVVQLSQLFPLQERDFSDFKISVPRDVTPWCGEYLSETPVASEKQAAEDINRDKGEILKLIDGVFKQKQLSYFAYASLLIHAEYYHDIFNSGQVETVKIGMLRDDFEKARQLFEKQTRLGKYEVRTSIEELDLPRRTIQIGRRLFYYKYDEKGKFRFENKFAGVEITAFDYVPDEYEQARFYFWQMRKRNTVYDRAVVYRTNRLYKRENRLSGIYGKLSNQFLTELINRAVVKFKGRTNTVSCVTPSRSNIITLDRLFPLKRCRFRDFEINVPNDISVWCHLFTPEVEEQTKGIQQVSLGILKKIDKVCEELGIGYFICGGSMLGAVRHGGFIPWDDDIDIGMLRSDYKVFLEKGQKLLGDSVFLQTRETDPEIPYLFSKVRANNTLYITNYNEYRNFHKGICVDIFPFDNIPDDAETQNNFKEEVRFWEKIHNRVVNKQKPEQYFISEKKRTFAEKMIHLLNEGHRRFYRLIPLWLTQKLYLRKAEKYNENENLQYVASFVPSYTFIKRDDLLPYKRLNFAGFQALVPRRPEVFLEMQYGDFMAMPPEHKRMGHDLIAWSADTTKEDGEKK